MIKIAKKELAILLILITFGLACAGRRPIANNLYVLAKRPDAKPQLQDKSPQLCPECVPTAQGQRMWKITERDFLMIKEKLVEQDDYIEYLLDLIQK